MQCLGVYIDDSGPAPRATLKTYVLLQARFAHLKLEHGCPPINTRDALAAQGARTPPPQAKRVLVLLQARDELHAIVLSEADWRREFLPKGRQSRHQAQPGLLPTADDRI